MSIGLLRILGLFLLGLLVVAVVGIMLARRVFEKRRRAERSTMDARRCACGYVLIGLSVPRCPECGRLVGFDKTAEELGISEAEMRAHAARRGASP